MTPAPPPTARRLETAATIALTAVTVAVGLGLGRLFVDPSFLGGVIAVALLTHLWAWATRRWNWPTLPALAGGLTLGVLMIVVLRYGAVSTFGLPNGTVLDRLGADLRAGWQVFQNEGAPAPVADGLVVAAMAAMVAVATTSDALAFRSGVRVEAVAPAAGLFVFTTVLSGPDHRVSATLLFLAAVLGFVLAHRVARRADADGWMSAPRGQGATAMLRAGAAMAAIGLVGGVLIAPLLPGADADPLIDLDRVGGDSRVTISPLVDIQSRLVDQADVEVFTVRSNQRSYWRLTALDRFDGSLWSAGGDYVDATGPLPRPETPDPVDRREIRQEIDIEALADIWLPAAYEPTSVETDDVGVEWNDASSSLIVDGDHDSSDDITYDVVSSAPVIDPGRAAAGAAAGPELDALRLLPEDFSPTAVRVAADVTASATTPYEQALALQDFFRTEFEYSLDVQPGHGESDIDAFLQTRVGYCEQFAGTFAALARAVGLPARVAVGFTTGAADPDDPGLFHVRGEHAHAWPEVYLEGLGWASFEPTPGRGAPGAEGHTRVAEQQQGERAPGVPAPTTTTTSPAAPGLEAEGLPSAAPTPTTAAPTAAPSRRPATGWRTPAVAVLFLLGIGWLVGVPATLAWRRRRDRRQATDDPGAEVAAAWRAATDSLGRAGIERAPAETPSAFATRIGSAFSPDRHQAVSRLAGSVTTLWFAGPGQVDTSMAVASRAAIGPIDQAAREQAGRRRWWLSALDPRRLLRW
jgi:transglutaminase-like putative cysteine protease